MNQEEKDTLLIFMVIMAIGLLVTSLVAFIDLKQSYDKIEQLETKLKYERYDKTMQRLQLEQLRTCVLAETRMQNANSNMWITADCYRYAEVK